MASTSTLQHRRARVQVTIGANDSTFADTAASLDSDEQIIATPTGASTSSGLTVYTWTENRMAIRLSQGGRQFGALELQVFGLTLDTMNSLSRLWLTPLNVRPQDTVRVETWEPTSQQWVPLFFGSVQWCAPRGNSMPQVPLVISANSNTALAQSAVAPYSASGTLKLTDVLTTILTGSGFTLNVPDSFPAYTIINPRASGSVLDQVKTMLNAFPNIAWNTSLQQVVLRVVGTPLYADPITIGPTTGMNGSPEYSTSGVQVDTLFDSRFVLGQAIKLDTVFTYATEAEWSICAIEHDLQPNVPNGRWHTRLLAQGITNVNGTGTTS